MGNRRDALRNSNPFAERPKINLNDLTDSMLEGEPQLVERVVEIVPANALVALEDGSMQLGSYTLTVKGLVGGEDADKTQWELLGAVLQRLEGAIQWLIGDWFLQAEAKWGETYEAVAQKTGYNEHTLRQYAYVARNVQLSVRTDKLSFGHHERVAALPEDAQRAWLEWAVDQNASISQLRKAIKPPAPRNGLSDEEQEINLLGQFVQQNRAKIDTMKPEKRQEYAENAERLADYYARLARWVMGIK